MREIERMLAILGPDPFGDRLAAIGLITYLPNGQQVATDVDRLERVLQAIAAYEAQRWPRVRKPREVDFTVHWPLVAVCGDCGAHYRIDIAAGVERAKRHQDNLQHLKWQTAFTRPWKVRPDTTIEQPGERSTVRQPAPHDPGQLIVAPR